MTFTPATRVLGGTATQTGAFPLQFTAANGVGSDAVQNFTLNVVCPAINVTPGVPEPTGCIRRRTRSVDFNATGSTGSSFTWGATGLPAGLAIDTTTGVVSGTPTNTVLNGAVPSPSPTTSAARDRSTPTITVRPTTDNETYIGGVGNTQYVVGVACRRRRTCFVNDNVKTGDNGPGALSVAFDPPANGADLGGRDRRHVHSTRRTSASPDRRTRFTYTLTDGNGVTNTGTVTINLSGMVWYVNSAGGNGDGRSHTPFNTLDDAAAPSGAGSIIYVHTGRRPRPAT